MPFVGEERNRNYQLFDSKAVRRYAGAVSIVLAALVYVTLRPEFGHSGAPRTQHFQNMQY